MPTGAPACACPHGCAQTCGRPRRRVRGNACKRVPPCASVTPPTRGRALHTQTRVSHTPGTRVCPPPPSPASVPQFPQGAAAAGREGGGRGGGRGEEGGGGRGGGPAADGVMEKGFGWKNPPPAAQWRLCSARGPRGSSPRPAPRGCVPPPPPRASVSPRGVGWHTPGDGAERWGWGGLGSAGQRVQGPGGACKGVQERARASNAVRWSQMPRKTGAKPWHAGQRFTVRARACKAVQHRAIPCKAMECCARQRKAV